MPSERNNQQYHNMFTVTEQVAGFGGVINYLLQTSQRRPLGVKTCDILFIIIVKINNNIIIIIYNNNINLFMKDCERSEALSIVTYCT